MSQEDKLQNVHSYFSTDCFNNCWNFIDKADRAAEEVEDMLLLANASLWHWKQRNDATPTNLSVGYWQVSRVYALAGEYGMARKLGDRCLQIGQENTLPAFYIGYAYEALARAESLQKNSEQAKKFLTEARKELENVTDKDEKELLKADLDSLEK